VKLPKSFLAVNLSETHTFHKKEELDEGSNGSTTLPDMERGLTKDEKKEGETEQTNTDSELAPDASI